MWSHHVHFTVLILFRQIEQIKMKMEFMKSENKESPMKMFWQEKHYCK